MPVGPDNSDVGNMPEYTFICQKCNLPITVIHGMTEEHPKTHPGCGGELRQQYSPMGIHYKHGGFYSTDKVLFEPEKE